MDRVVLIDLLSLVGALTPLILYIVIDNILYKLVKRKQRKLKVFKRIDKKVL